MSLREDVADMMREQFTVIFSGEVQIREGVLWHMYQGVGVNYFVIIEEDKEEAMVLKPIAKMDGKKNIFYYAAP